MLVLGGLLSETDTSHLAAHNCLQDGDDDSHAGDHVHLVPLHVHTTHPTSPGHLPELLLQDFIQKPFFLPLLSPASLCSPELWICKWKMILVKLWLVFAYN